MDTDNPQNARELVAAFAIAHEKRYSVYRPPEGAESIMQEFLDDGFALSDMARRIKKLFSRWWETNRPHLSADGDVPTIYTFKMLFNDLAGRKARKSQYDPAPVTPQPQPVETRAPT